MNSETETKEVKGVEAPLDLCKYLRSYDQCYLDAAKMILNPDKTLAKFRVGNFPHVIGGHPIVMASRSPLMKEILPEIMKTDEYHIFPTLKVSDGYSLCPDSKCDRYHDDGKMSSFLTIWMYLNGIHVYHDIDSQSDLADDAMPLGLLTHETFFTLMAWFQAFWIDDPSPVMDSYYREISNRCISLSMKKGSIHPKVLSMISGAANEIKKRLSDEKGSSNEHLYGVYNVTQVVLVDPSSVDKHLYNAVKTKEGLQCSLYGTLIGVLSNGKWSFSEEDR